MNLDKIGRRSSRDYAQRGSTCTCSSEHIRRCLICCLHCTPYTVEPLNKGHIGDNVDSESPVLSFLEGLFSFRGSQCIKTIGKSFWLHYWRFNCSLLSTLYRREVDSCES